MKTKLILIIGICVLLFVSGCNKGEEPIATISTNLLETATPIEQCFNETQVYLYPSVKDENTYFNTTYKLILNGNYLGKFEGKRESYLNLSYGDTLEILSYSNDCKMYHNYEKLIIPCKSTYYIQPELKCASEFYFSVLKDYLPIKDNIITIKDYLILDLNINSDLPFDYIGCDYDKPKVRDFHIKYEGSILPSSSLRTQQNVNQIYTQLKYHKDYNLEYELDYEPFNTTVLCYFFDEDYYLTKHNQIDYGSTDENWEDLGLENPSFNFTIIKR